MDTNQKNYEISKIVKDNLENFQLFASSIDKYTQNIFEISSPYNFLFTQYMKPEKDNSYFSLDGQNIFNLMASGSTLKDLLFSSKKGIVYQPDFDSLSTDVKEKLKSGVYKIGESKKVEGNARSVIVDTTNSNQRVEDLTLKEVVMDNRISQQLTNLAIQQQLKQINEILLNIQETQEYQLQWNRNNSILSPFWTARTLILEFQNTDDVNKKIQLLQDASHSMEQSVSAIKADLISNKDQLEKIVNKIIYNYSSFERHTNSILEDINLLLKIVSMQTYIDFTLDNEALAIDRFNSIDYIFKEYSSRSVIETSNNFFNKLEGLPLINNFIPDSKLVEQPSFLELIHDNYKYNSENTDLWLNINNEMLQGEQFRLLSEGDLDHE